MSATAFPGDVPERWILVGKVADPEGRCALLEAISTAVGGVSLAAGRTADRKSRKRGRGRTLHVAAPCAGVAELALMARAMRRGWSALLSAHDVRIPASHPEAYRVKVVPLDEPCYDASAVARLRTDPDELVAVMRWVHEGSKLAMPAEPERVLRATAAGVV